MAAGFRAWTNARLHLPASEEPVRALLSPDLLPRHLHINQSGNLHGAGLVRRRNRRVLNNAFGGDALMGTASALNAAQSSTFTALLLAPDQGGV
jgi:hypothetical protein